MCKCSISLQIQGTFGFQPGGLVDSLFDEDFRAPSLICTFSLDNIANVFVDESKAPR